MSHKQLILSLHAGSGKGAGVRESSRFPAAGARDVTFLRSWLVYDSTLASQRSGKFNWNFLTGMLLAGALSAGFWAGIGAAIASWK
jgi:hypothetical protein